MSESERWCWNLKIFCKAFTEQAKDECSNVARESSGVETSKLTRWKFQKANQTNNKNLQGTDHIYPGNRRKDRASRGKA